MNGNAATKTHTYFVKGMHCPSCELLVEKKLSSLQGVQSVDASMAGGQVRLEYRGIRPTTDRLNKLFEEDGYAFSNEPFAAPAGTGRGTLLTVLGVSLLLILGFAVLESSGLSSLVHIDAQSALPAFFVFGLLAGTSSCAALVGGIVLSMSRQWSQMYLNEPSPSPIQRFQPHLLFNFGRLASYAVLGGALGAIGSGLKLSLTFSSILVIAVSVLMLLLGLQMVGVKALQGFQISAPKFITRYSADEAHFQGRYMPFVMGAFTFFLPCGFTITAQSLALLSGSAIQGSLIMLTFALGTLPMLLAIGLSSLKLLESPHLSSYFLKIAGVMVLFFALYNLNAQLNVLGFSTLSDIGLQSDRTASASARTGQEEALAPVVDGKQVMAMDASAYGYSPNHFRVRAGMPVRWEITDKGTSGCTNAVIARKLFSDPIPLTPGQTSVKEFTPQRAGRYKFSCWMGMISGAIDVVDIAGS